MFLSLPKLNNTLIRPLRCWALFQCRKRLMKLSIFSSSLVSNLTLCISQLRTLSADEMMIGLCVFFFFCVFAIVVCLAQIKKLYRKLRPDQTDSCHAFVFLAVRVCEQLYRTPFIEQSFLFVKTENHLS